MRSGGERHRIFIGSAAPCARLRFICRRYAALPGDVSISYALGASYAARREPMLDLALFLGFALLCVYVAYERLCNRW